METHTSGILSTPVLVAILAALAAVMAVAYVYAAKAKAKKIASAVMERFRGQNVLLASTMTEYLGTGACKHKVGGLVLLDERIEFVTLDGKCEWKVSKEAAERAAPVTEIAGGKAATIEIRTNTGAVYLVTLADARRWIEALVEWTGQERESAS